MITLRREDAEQFKIIWIIILEQDTRRVRGDYNCQA